MCVRSIREKTKKRPFIAAQGSKIEIQRQTHYEIHVHHHNNKTKNMQSRQSQVA